MSQATEQLSGFINLDDFENAVSKCDGVTHNHRKYTFQSPSGLLLTITMIDRVGLARERRSTTKDDHHVSIGMASECGVLMHRNVFNGAGSMDRALAEVNVYLNLYTLPPKLRIVS